MLCHCQKNKVVFGTQSQKFLIHVVWRLFCITKAELSSDGDRGPGNLIFAIWFFTHRLFPAPRLEEGRNIPEFDPSPVVTPFFLIILILIFLSNPLNFYLLNFTLYLNKMFHVSSLRNSHPTAVPDTCAGDLLDVEKLAKGTFILSTPDLIQFFTSVLYFLLFSSMLCSSLLFLAHFPGSGTSPWHPTSTLCSFLWQWDCSLVPTSTLSISSQQPALFPLPLFLPKPQPSQKISWFNSVTKSSACSSLIIIFQVSSRMQGSNCMIHCNPSS